MAAYFTTTLSWSASNLASPVFSAKRARNLITAAAPSPSLLPSPSLAFSSTHRPNKAELEARLAGAHIRASHRRLRSALGHEQKGPSTIATAPRTTRAAAFSLPSRDAPTTPTTLATPSFPASPLSRFAHPGAGNHFAHPSAPSPSMLPPLPTTQRPLFPQRRSRAPIRAAAVVGLGLGFAPLGLPEVDAPLSPYHVYPATLRRTPGAPLRAEREAQDGMSYFHLPADIITPQLLAGGMGPVAIGLGIMNIDI